MSQDDYENLPTVPYIEKQARLIPSYPELPAQARARFPLLYILKKLPKKELAQDPSLNFIPWYPAGTTGDNTNNNRK